MTVRRSILALLFSAGTCTAFAQQPEPPAARRITLREAVDLALARNHAVRLARLSVEEKDTRQGRGEERLLSPGAQRNDARPPDGYTVDRNSGRRARRCRC